MQGTICCGLLLQACLFTHSGDSANRLLTALRFMHNRIKLTVAKRQRIIGYVKGIGLTDVGDIGITTDNELLPFHMARTRRCFLISGTGRHLRMSLLLRLDILPIAVFPRPRPGALLPLRHACSCVPVEAHVSKRLKHHKCIC